MIGKPVHGMTADEFATWFLYQAASEVVDRHAADRLCGGDGNWPAACFAIRFCNLVTRGS